MNISIMFTLKNLKFNNHGQTKYLNQKLCSSKFFKNKIISSFYLKRKNLEQCVAYLFLFCLKKFCKLHCLLGPNLIKIESLICSNILLNFANRKMVDFIDSYQQLTKYLRFIFIRLKVPFKVEFFGIRYAIH